MRDHTKREFSELVGHLLAVEGRKVGGDWEGWAAFDTSHVNPGGINYASMDVPSSKPRCIPNHQFNISIEETGWMGGVDAEYHSGEDMPAWQRVSNLLRAQGPDTNYWRGAFDQTAKLIVGIVTGVAA